MNEQTVPVHLELKLAGDALSGRVVYGAGEERRFTGFIGLLGVIDALVEQARDGRLQIHPEIPLAHAEKGASHGDH